MTTQTPTDAAPDAREVIAKAFKDTYVGHPWTDDGANRRADELIDALHAAGYRIVPAADPETVTISRAAAQYLAHFVLDAKHFDPEYDQWAYDELKAALQQREGGEK